MGTPGDEEEEDDDDDDDLDEDEGDYGLPGSVSRDGEAGFEGEQDEDQKVQRKLHLFRCSSVQASIKRLWDMLPKNADGELGMEGYLELNLRLQKCLTQEFILDRAVDSAIGDWSEDVHEGQQSMPAEEFAMFLFELCSLWCGPCISLRAYLLFLNAAFIAITEARGAHTIGLKPLEAIERLQKAFFDLLAMQGWARSPADDGDPAEALNAWYAANLAPDAERAAVLQAQRQVFQVTHDVRAVFLFRDGGEQEDVANLELVKQSSRNLAKVFRAQPPKGLPAAPPADERTQVGEIVPQSNCPRPWWPSTHSRAPGVPQALSEEACTALATVAATAAVRRHLSAPSRARPGSGGSTGQLAVPQVLTRQPRFQERALPPRAPEAVPIGRAFDTRRAAPRGRGLMVLAGQAALTAGLHGFGTATAGSRGLPALPGAGAATRPPAPEASDSLSRTEGSADPLSSISSRDHGEPGTYRTEVVGAHVSVSSVLDASSEFSLEARAQQSHNGATQEDPLEAPEASQHSIQSCAAALSQRIGGPPGQESWIDPVEQPRIANLLEGAQYLPPYKLPKDPCHLYQKQTVPLMATRPGCIVYAANKMQAAKPLLPEPFDRALRRLPPELRPPREGPQGPMGHPNEPVWFEMSHRLQGILDKQARRAERRRKRRLRSKLFHGRSSSRPPKRDEGRELREYLDRSAAEFADGPPNAPGEPAGEFLGRVHERWVTHRDRIQSPRFQVSGPQVAGIDKYTRALGETTPRPPRVVRPVYVPPPGVAAESATL